ncbi:hypothetical protein FA10DRAFT_267614 [Acaromyces ingoldii]|uniref:Uncharacterized protein n=1 Tax=Acaromyces ingoldii TaxID=215250 RepID=A0A316YHU9_9BASI|nr:hypothetical protein FA10DRAFT_267614 [Acaromyces ingoldii]PWN89007.1 hypothetical protein FA10DRAFT_267614 [Acaromyces ingoldii]
MPSHSVVPIGGPAFISPLSSGRIPTTVDTASRLSSSSGSSSSDSSSSTTSSPLSPSGSGQLSLGGGSQSPTSESEARPKMDDASLEAALAYSNALRRHTQRMWEKERSSIEKAKVEAAADAVPSSPSQSNRHQSEAGPARRSSLGSSLGLDSILSRGRKRHAKTSSVV